MQYFTLEELQHSATATVRKIPNKANKEQLNNLKLLIENVLDPARKAFGSPITVSSGFRSEALNKAVGGAKTSQHTKGQAADLQVKSLDDLKRLFNIIRSQDNFDQLIWENTWVHVSFNLGNNRHQVLKYRPQRQPHYITFTDF